MLARVILPPGSRFVTVSPTPLLAKQSMYPDGISSQAAEFAVSGRSAASMLSFLESHQAPGTRLQSTGTVAGQINFVSEYIANLGPGVAANELDISVVPGPGGTGSDVRIDATVALQPPRPPGTLVPVTDTVAVVSVTSPPPGSDGPVRLPAPERVVVTSAEVVARLRAAADQLPVAAVTPISCPKDSGVRYVVAFAASTTAAPDITFTAGLCGGMFVDVSTGPPQQNSSAGRLVPGHLATAPRAGPAPDLPAALSNDASFAKAYEQVLAQN